MHRIQHKSKGVALVEFALAVLLFFIVVFGIVEFSRTLLLINTANKSIQLATRYSTVCGLTGGNLNTTQLSKVKSFINASGQNPTAGNTSWPVIGLSDGCTSASSVEPCMISTSNSGLSVTLSIPVFAIQIPLPISSLTQMSESFGVIQNSAFCQ